MIHTELSFGIPSKNTTYKSVFLLFNKKLFLQSIVSKKSIMKWLTHLKAF